MKITASQRKALEAAGYTVGKSGTTVQNKSGGTVGGYNENGKVFGGSSKVMNILKAPEAKATPKAAPKASKPSAPKSKPVAKDAMKGYRPGDVTTSKIPKGGRGDGGAERVRRVADAALNKVSGKPASASGKSSSGEYGYADWQKMSRADRKAKGLPTSEIGAQLKFKRMRSGITGKEYKVKGN
jgi:hypothetical protein